MPDREWELKIDEELARIPAEYRDAFRQALERELAETEENKTDTGRLAYLRRRREEFQQGGFIRPDGRPGLVVLSPEARYEKALPELAQDSLDAEADPADRRRTLVKVGLFAGLALLLLLVAVRGRAQRAASAGVPVEEVENAPAGDVSLAAGAATTTPSLPEISGAEDSLQTIGGLGGALTIGRPGAVEITYRRTEETIALAIDPSKPTTRGELRYDEATMRSDNPVAVWLFGTVLNYAIGIPDSLVRNLEAGDRITLSTDTGAALRFVVAETGQGASYEAGRLLSQNRLGLTLFALPAVAEDDVAFAFAGYDVTAEEGQEQEIVAVGDVVPLSSGGNLQVLSVNFSHTAGGEIRIVIEGETNKMNIPQILLSLTAGNEQTTATPVAPDGEGQWQAVFDLPDTVSGRPLFAEFRSLPAGSPVVVGLGDIPRLAEQLVVEVTRASWDSTLGQAVLAVSIFNPGEGAVFLSPEFIQLLPEGGDAYDPLRPVDPALPLLINPGETVELTLSFLPQAVSMRLQIGAGLWEVAGFPDGDPVGPADE